VLIFVCVALTAPAFAFGYFRSRTTDLFPATRGAVRATCPIGEHTDFGGGWSEVLGRPIAPGAMAYVTDMHMATGATWTVNGENGSTSAKRRLGSYVYCSAGTRGVPTTIARTVSIAPFAERSVTATCPPKLVVIAGGFHTPARPAHPGDTPPRALVNGLELTSARSWRATARNVSSTAWITLTAIAYCGHGPTVRVVTASTSVGAASTGNVAAVCPTGTKLAFGGYRATTFFPNAFGGGTIAAEGFGAQGHDAWGVSGINLNLLSGVGQMVALAYCS